ncbi:MAG TPA: TIGR03560 family F420-dependent LLM class oxidoreductase [Solirubrobacteraceae bacterium]|jgi:F420-dependent oxidoreductase-like protein|nr:TIGR03560 family F420-dependent LLM class oxidoreductase [Solirubrobacteraceae bacterium]
MQLALMIEGQEGVTWAQWQALARACEGHGVGTLFRSDHYLNLDGQHPERGSLDAWATICALASATSTLRLGTLVSPTSFRHPSVLAKVAASADQISGGRIDVGLGAGWHEAEHHAYGFPFLEARQRMDVLAEQLEVIVGTWTQEDFSFDGEHYRIQGLRAEPRPVQSPHPPLIMGGMAGPRSALLAARFADEYNTVYATVAEVNERRERIVQACEAAGRAPLPFSVMTVVITGTDEGDLRRRTERVAHVRGVPAENLGGPGWIVGPLEEVVAQLGQLRAAGVHRVMCQHFAHDDLEFVELVGRVLAPALA